MKSTQHAGRWIVGLAVAGLLVHIPAAAQPLTEVVVVGTVHAATASYTSRDLIRILDSVKPDVILFEYPADMMTPSYEFKSIAKGSVEQEAVIDYVKRTGARVRPYDMDGRNAFYDRTDYFSRQQQCNAELSAQTNARSLSPDAQAIMDSLRAANGKRDRIGESSPRTINGFQADAELNEKQWLMQQGIPEVVRLTPALKACESFWNLSRAYWTRRNNEMIANIKRFAKEFPGKRLVVLCGYEHRYLLRSGLMEWDERPAYVVREYWEY